MLYTVDWIAGYTPLTALYSSRVMSNSTLCVDICQDYFQLVVCMQGMQFCTQCSIYAQDKLHAMQFLCQKKIFIPLSEYKFTDYLLILKIRVNTSLVN